MPRKNIIFNQKNCQCCNNVFKYDSQQKNRKYCGYVCAKKSRESKKEIECYNCKKRFIVQSYSNAKFCSRDCKYNYQSSNLIVIYCDNCGKEFKRKEHKIRYKYKFCSHKCTSIFLRGKNHYEWKEHLRDKNINLALKQWSLKIKEKDEYTCQLCGENDRRLLESHHIKEKNKFPELKFDFNNGITLCLKCHALQHINDKKSLRLINWKINKHYAAYNN